MPKIHSGGITLGLRPAIVVVLLIAMTTFALSAFARPVERLVLKRDQTENGYTAERLRPKGVKFKAVGVRCPSCNTLLNGKFKVRVKLIGSDPIEQEMEFRDGNTAEVTFDFPDVEAADVAFPD